MKISELIKALEAMKENFGDLPIYHLNDGDAFELHTITHKKAEKRRLLYWEYDLPERIELDE